ncbi:MAG: phosphotransferase [Pseudomonadota bacterium]
MSESQYNSVNDERLRGLSDWLALKVPAGFSLTPLATDAGMRRYFRLCNAQSTLVAVDANPDTEDNNAFIAIEQRIRQCGLQVPQIHHYNLEKGFLLIEDLGNTHLQQWLSDNADSQALMYQRACDALIQMQQRAHAHNLPVFEREFILFELGIFKEWYLHRHLRIDTEGSISHLLDPVNEALVSNCEAQPQVFMHRDFHCRNLMVTPAQQLAIIDFQGAMLGPVTYDPGSLLRDIYVQVPATLENDLCEHHRQSVLPHVNRQQYRRWYQLTALQRHLKIMGLFCRLHYRDAKPQYLALLPTVKKHITETLNQYPEFKAFNQWFDTLDKSRSVAP